MAKRRPSHLGHVGALDPGIRLWLLRILVSLGRHRDFIGQSGFNNDSLAEALGLGYLVDQSQSSIPPFLRSHTSRDSEGEFDAKRALADLRKLHQTAETQWSKDALPACLRHNVVQLSGLVGLNNTDCRILEFAVSLHNERLLDDTADWLGHLSSVKVFHTLSAILGVPETEVRTSLGPQSILSCSGLLSVDRGGTSTLRGKLNLLSDVFADLMATAEADPISLLRGTVSKVPAGQLQLSDYEHVTSDLEILQPYLRHAVQTGRRGVNIFLHGAPGTGKSQLARALAKALDCELFEVASEDADGDPVNGERRLRAFRAAQSFFSRRKALVVFDEVEDVFNDGDGLFGRKSTAQVRKAWINRMLEENPIPTLWLSNSIRGLDPAFIRRFDMVFELPVPPRKQRARILQDLCGDLIGTAQISGIAEAETLAPAVVAKASSVVRAIRSELGSEQVGAAFERLISNTLAAQGHHPVSHLKTNRLPDVYDPAFIQANADLAEIARGLALTRSGRLCLYGPPGTGKTAYGNWLAQQLEVPIRVKRASELMSMWVGGNEKNIANAFREAETDGAILMLDEVDSFLQDRRGAQRSWEITMVNEMLTQLESFPGIFIASTNLMGGLDQAALRRFDLKVKFDFLSACQTRSLFSRHCENMGLGMPTEAVLAVVTRIHQLTPGDFAAVLRQHRFRPITECSAFAAALQSEWAIKQESKASIGFL